LSLQRKVTNFMTQGSNNLKANASTSSLDAESMLPFVIINFLGFTPGLRTAPAARSPIVP
jgi:hypothetical protein